MNSPLRVGLIGYGWHAHMFGELVKGHGDKPLANIVAVADTDPTVLRRAQGQFDLPDAHFYDNTKNLLDHEQLDAVIVSTPTTDRSPVVAALERRIAVFCENPLATDMPTADHICRLAKNTPCTVDDQWLLLPQVGGLRRQWGSGRIGSLRLVEIGGKGRHATRLEIPRIGSHLFNVAAEFTGDITSGHAMEWNKGRDVIATFQTANDIPLVAKFLSCPTGDPDVGRCYIRLEGTAGQLLAIGGLLESLWYNPLPYPSVGQPSTENLNGWEQLPYAVGTWSIRYGQEIAAMECPALNPTWLLWAYFVEAVRGQRENPLPPAVAMPAVKAMTIINRSLQRPPVEVA